MKNNIWIALGMLISSMCVGYAQQVPTFQFTMYFTDAKGNQDSIVLGYAPDAHNIDFIDPQYDEHDVTEVPFDTVLDVRVYMFRYYNTGLYLDKQIVDSSCDNLFVSPFDYLVIYAKYPPLKISWDNDLFYSYDYPCHAFSYICADEAPFFDCVTCPSIMYLQFANYRNVTFEEYYNYETTNVMLEDGNMGEAYNYWFGFLDVPWSTFGTKNSGNMSLQIYPSIAREAVQLVGDFGEEADVHVLDVTGKEHPCVSTPTSEGFSVDVAYLPSGMYMVHTHIKGSNSIAVGRFVKL
jgi:hypothetical protein